MSVPREEATFRSLLREHRLAAGLTQEALSERSGVSARTIQEVEAGHTHPRQSTVRDLARALGLSGADRDDLLRLGLTRPRQRITATPAADAARQVVPDVAPAPEPAPEESARESSLLVLPRPRTTNVPWPVSDLLGREVELGVIRGLLTTDRRRMVTLTGMGGSGKTRLAVEAAHELLDAFVDGVWFVELASVSVAALVPRVVAAALGVRDVQDMSILDALLGALRRRHLLLVLDNCEHLIDACARLAERLLASCPDLAILATSREPLRIAGEYRRSLRPLDVPDPNVSAPVEALGTIASVRLFVERARAIDPEFALTEWNADPIARICSQLDGIPLALELAASRIGVLTADQIAARLDGSFRLLTGGTRAGPTRQQTMEAALDWSYDLLSDAEQAAFRALSTFAGGFDLDAAERVGGAHLTASTGAESPPADVLDILSGLVDKSLVIAERSRHGRRYRLLEPVRQYAALRLVAEGEAEGAGARHAAYYATLAERAAPLLHGPEQIAWLSRLEAERDNLRATLTWTAEHGEAEAGLRLAVALTPHWEAHAYLGEGRHWLHRFLDAPGAAGASAQARLPALMSAGLLALWQGDLARAHELLSEALQQAEALGAPLVDAEARIWLATTSRRLGEPARALALTNEALRLSRELSNEWLAGLALLQAGVAYRDMHAVDRAVAALEESVDRLGSVGDVRWAASAATMLGWALLEAGLHERAAHSLRDGALALRDAGDQSFFLFALRGLAYVSHARGEHLRAARWYGASEALRVAQGVEHPKRNREHDAIFLESVRAHLTTSAYDRALAAGEAMTFDQVCSEIDAAQ
jgi:non-specific serine/threonine protein kinase